jgi:hypothetical protein|uniref:Type II toxin-antitoxin system MqsR family toxin n=1 Tax=Shewanella sp. 33B TaxID=592146 RepID=B9W0T4_9GAMM|nr:type II toxin-antitoxin system MqsR family toxin [Shewanella sp. 33B]ACM47544.1 hypothetical protein [Shewanella sp. 33B]
MVTSKRKPTYNLTSIQKALKTVKTLKMTFSARRDATDLGFDDQDVISAIQSIQAKDFYKTMPSIDPSYPYQDVYKFMYKELYIYIKFQDINGSFVVSFKEV